MRRNLWVISKYWAAFVLNKASVLWIKLNILIIFFLSFFFTILKNKFFFINKYFGKQELEILEKQFKVRFDELKNSLVEKSGAWYSYNSERIGQGRENAKIYLKENPEIAKTIEDTIRSQNQEKVTEIEDSEKDFTDKEIKVD